MIYIVSISRRNFYLENILDILILYLEKIYLFFIIKFFLN